MRLCALCGVNPAAILGKADRHRLNRCGGRQANTAPRGIAHARLVHEGRTKAYAAKRTAFGDNRKEVMRRFKRHIVREVYPSSHAMGDSTCAVRGHGIVLESDAGRTARLQIVEDGGQAGPTRSEYIEIHPILRNPGRSSPAFKSGSPFTNLTGSLTKEARSYSIY